MASNKGQQLAFLHIEHFVLLCMMSINSSIGYFSTVEVEHLAKLNTYWYWIDIYINDLY